MTDKEKKFIKDYCKKWLPETIPTKMKFVNVETDYFIECMLVSLSNNDLNLKIKN